MIWFSDDVIDIFMIYSYYFDMIVVFFIGIDEDEILDYVMGVDLDIVVS